MARNRYTKLELAQPATINLMGATIFGQWQDKEGYHILIERPLVKRAARARKSVAPKSQPATAFPPPTAKEA